MRRRTGTRRISTCTGCPWLNGQQRPGGARIAVFRFSDTAVIDEEDTLDLTHPRLMGVPKDEHIRIRALRNARQGARIPIFEQVLIHPPRRAVHQAEAPALRLEANLRDEGAQVGLVLRRGDAASPEQGLLTPRFFVFVLVGAAAVIAIKPDPIVVVAHDGGDATLADER